MTEQEILEGNKLICWYLGGKVSWSYNVKGKDYFAWHGDMVPKYRTLFGLANGADQVMIDQCKFHSDWNALMPVVEKIAKYYNVSIRWYDGDCVASTNNTSLEETEIADTGNYTPSINNVWQTVVKTIKYHNKNKIK